MSENSEQAGTTEQLQLINEFVKLTGAPEDHAAHVLNLFNWNLDLAISNHFDESDDMTELNPANSVNTDSSNQIPKIQTMERDSGKPMEAEGGATRFKNKSSSSSNKFGKTDTNIATLDTVREKQADSEEEEGQAFYAGGSVNSGQQVLGPSKKEQGGHNIVREMFRDAMSHGAEPVPSSHNAPRALAFKGVGHVLGAPGVPSQVVSSHSGNDEPMEEEISICLKAWRNGFSIDDGPLREYSDSDHKNKEFLDAVRQGQIPPELSSRLSRRGQVIHLHLEDNSREDYTPPKRSIQVFSGAGFRLGSPTSPMSAAQSSAGDPKAMAQNEKEAEEFLNVDETLPVTSVQVRLADGFKTVLRLNHTHTVNDIRRYIILARPNFSTSEFSLMTSYPPVKLADDNMTVVEAKLLNSVIVQKLN